MGKIRRLLQEEEATLENKAASNTI